MATAAKGLTFWDHLDELRAVIVKVALVAVFFSVVASCFKDELFAVILAPTHTGFVTYGLLDRLGGGFMFPDGGGEATRLINTELAQQFLIHMKVAFCAGIICASPYILFQLFRFVSPALYADERRHLLRVAVPGYFMFLLGVLLSYFLIFPLTYRFLGSYQVSGSVENMISLESYISTLAMLSLWMGVMFELPILCWLFARLGVLTPGFMRARRKHAVVVILILAAIITPTSDIFTLLVVSLPVYLLYEASIHVVKHASKPRP